MDETLKTTLLTSADTLELKWLFGSGKMPAYSLYIYDGLPDDYILWFETEILITNSWTDIYARHKAETYLDHLKSRFLSVCEWIEKFSNLIRAPFDDDSDRVCCMVETKQQYDKWSKKDILILIESWGKAANMLYCAERDTFNSCPVLNRPKYEPLNMYYLLSLEYLMWCFATFVQPKDSHFTDLLSVLNSYFIRKN